MKTGIYGGTFNPIHLGHLHILQEFIRRLSLDRVLLIPTRIPPHKQAESLAEVEDRLEMCRLAAEEITEAPVLLSRLELSREGKSYTAETLEELKREFPGDEFYLLMGEDMFLTVDRWYRPETIFALAKICASPRSADGFRQLKEKKRELEDRFGARCCVEDIPYWKISSTEIRKMAAAGEELNGMTPVSVAKYIREHKLYEKGGRRE